MLLFDHPIFPHLIKYAHMPRDTGHCDFLQLPDSLREIALDVRTNCISCNAVIQPLRCRALSHRSRVSGTATEKRLFYSATCPPDKNSGCTRSKEVAKHKKLLKAKLGTAIPREKQIVTVDTAAKMWYEEDRLKLEISNGDMVLLDPKVVFRAYHFLKLEELK